MGLARFLDAPGFEAHRMTDRGWGRSFEDPIEADGRKLVTLRDAGEYIAALPKKDHDAPEWQARHGSIDAGCRARWPDDVRPDRHHVH